MTPKLKPVDEQVIMMPAAGRARRTDRAGGSLRNHGVRHDPRTETFATMGGEWVPFSASPMPGRHAHGALNQPGDVEL